MGKVTLKMSLLLPATLVTSDQIIGDVKFVAACNLQSPAQPGQLMFNEPLLTIIPNAGSGRNTPTTAELALVP